MVFCVSAYLMRKAFDDFLFWLMPNYWVPLYNSVSFTHMPYKKCIDNRAWQDKTLNNVLKFSGFVAACTVTFGAFHALRNNNFEWKFDSLMSKFKF
jgi:kynurenine 3-monooxygenase